MLLYFFKYFIYAFKYLLLYIYASLLLICFLSALHFFIINLYPSLIFKTNICFYFFIRLLYYHNAFDMLCSGIVPLSRSYAFLLHRYASHCLICFYFLSTYICITSLYAQMLYMLYGVYAQVLYVLRYL